MAKRKFFKWLLILVIAGVVVAGGIGLYLFNKPHRDVQASSIDFSISSEALVQEFLNNPSNANAKYLDETGDSKIIAVTGTVHSISKDLKDQFVLLLKTDTAKVGVSCTFTQDTNLNAEKVKSGDHVTVKGVIRSGAGYDQDLDLYEDVVLEKCDLIKE
ncbi:MAG: hypothetical protein JSS79_17920 [Bacteroidetes bacterium]|nr:hypothetical protein [Bacteroidota bacterium]